MMKKCSYLFLLCALSMFVHNTAQAQENACRSRCNLTAQRNYHRWKPQEKKCVDTYNGYVRRCQTLCDNMSGDRNRRHLRGQCLNQCQQAFVDLLNGCRQYHGILEYNARLQRRCLAQCRDDRSLVQNKRIYLKSLTCFRDQIDYSTKHSSVGYALASNAMSCFVNKKLDPVQCRDTRFWLSSYATLERLKQRYFACERGVAALERR